MRLLLLTGMLMAQLPLAAQTSLTWRLTRNSPGPVRTASSRGEPIGPLGSPSTTTSLVRVTSRDSAGATIWEMAVDSVVRTVLDSTVSAPSPASERVTISVPAELAPLKLFRAVVRDGKVTGAERNGLKVDFVAEPATIVYSLLGQLQGLTFLAPKNGFTLKPGESRTDSGAYERRLVADGAVTREGITNAPMVPKPSTTPLPSDTIVTRWKRTADTVEAVRNTRGGLQNTLVSSSRESTSILRAVLDGSQRIVEAHLSTTNTTGSTPTSTRRTQTAKYTSSVSLVRIP